MKASNVNSLLLPNFLLRVPLAWCAVFLLYLFASTGTVLAQGSVASDRAALVVLYNATGGANWKNNTNWLSDKPIGQWYGVFTNGEGRVTHLVLDLNGLTGSIPSEIANLSALEVLTLGHNQLTGSIPPALGNLSKLTILYLHYNTGLRGPLPATLEKLTSLRNFFAFRTGLCVPPSLTSWYDRIGADDRRHGAALPACADGTSRVGRPTVTGSDRDILIAFYNATGGADWKNRAYWLSDLPIRYWHGVGADSEDRVTALNLADNGLTGALPPELGNLSDLEFLWLHGNRLTGSIPRELGNLSSLVSLSLFDNQLTGPIPAELGNLSNLEGLLLAVNRLTGSIPSELGKLFNLKSLALFQNRLTGPIPTELERLIHLTNFQISDTELCLPPALASWHAAIQEKSPISYCVDSTPVFAGKTVADQDYTRGESIGRVTLPQATGGDGALSYSLVPALPPGLHFDPSTRILSGTPAATQAAILYTYTARDADGGLARLTFTIGVTRAVNAASDRDPLVAIYNATGGANWQNNSGWLSERPIGEWFGVGTDASGQVVDLHLDENGLTGSIPPQLGNLSNLEYLYLDGNQLTGAIPAELSNLSNLRAISLANNRLTGRIPREFGHLSNLESIWLYRNQLTGPIPQELRNLPDLRYLVTFETELCLPSALESWHADIWFRDILPACMGAPTFGDRTIADQAYTIATPIAGLTLPAAQGGDGVLTYALTPALPRGLDFDASTRVLTGTPTTTRTATVYTYTARDTVGDTAHLTFTITVRGTMVAGSDRDALVAFYNATGGASWKNDGGWLGDGPLSSWHGVATDASGRVTRLALANNGLTGELPAELGNLSRLSTLYLYDNAGLTGPLSAEMGGLTNLGSLYTFGTGLCLPPTLASWHAEIGARSPIGTCASLSGTDRDSLVALYNATGGANWRTRTNWLSDRPIGQWHGITTDGSGRVVKIHLLSNGLSGRLPPALGELSKLRSLWLASNQLRGSIPRELGDLRNLETLTLSDNRLSGAIPSSLGTLPNLRYLFLSSNRLTGSIPPALGNLSRLVHLSLGENELTGPIPSALGKLRSLETLVLGNNRLAGQVPPQLGMLASLKILDLGVHDDGNGGITGPLPPELAKLTRVGRFNTYGTGLCLPSALASWHARIQDKDDMPRCGGVVGSDRETLTALYNATGGANWTNNNGWLSDRPIGEWHGVTADRAGRVTRLSLNSNGLAGTLPPELGGLSGLGALYLHGNGGLTGSLPSEMRQLTGLSTLYTFGTGLCLPPSLADWHSAIGTKNTISACFAQETLPATRDAVQAALDEARAAADTAVVANGAAHAAAAAAFEFVAAAVEAAEAARDSAAAAAAAEDAANMAAEAARYAVAADAAATDAGVSADAAQAAAVNAEAVVVVSPAGEALLAEINELAAMAQANAAMAAAAAVDAATIAKDAADAADLAMAYAAGSARLSVADARANEGSDSAITFRVTVYPAASQPVTVDYATRDGTAKAGEDYTKTSGKLTFAAGETAKTVSVALLDDAKDEGEETFRLLLSKAKGAVIANGEATGTIENDDPMPTAWLARFGRTVAGQAVDAVTGRLEGGGGSSHVTLGGRRMSLDTLEGRTEAAADIDAVARAFGSDPDAADGTRDREALMLGDDPAVSSRTMTGRELLLGSAFHLQSGDEAGGPAFAAWGRVAHGGFDGEEDGVTMDGEVATGFLGADVAGERWLAGVALWRSQGAGSYRDRAVADSHPDRGSGKVESRLTGVLPYARADLSDRVTAWGLLGYGTGALILTEKGGTETGRHEADLTMTLGAVGGRGTLVPAPEGGGFTLALRTDAFWVRTKSDAAANLAASDTDVTRLRLVLGASRAFETAGGTLTPSLEVGLRHDGGDADTGAGVEVGGGMVYADPSSGLSLEAKARMLVAHADSDYEEWGASATARLDTGERGRGLSFSLTPTLGVTSSASERLWGAQDVRALALAPDSGAFDVGRGLQAEAGYGLPLFGDRFTGTPNLGFGLADGGARDWRIGWRLTSAARGDPGFEASLDAVRREAANDGTPEHGVMLRGAMRW